MALWLLMPSAGFILDTLDRLGLHMDERHGITVKARNRELLAHPDDGERTRAMEVL